MSTVSVIFVCVVAAILAAILKQYNATFSLVTVIAAAIIIIAIMASKAANLFDNVFSVVDDIGETAELLKLLIKAVCISVLAEISSNICKDSGNSSLAVCVDVTAKIILFALAFSLVEYLITIIQDLFN
ncbi:MAG: stage III sporulation AC/AD family protein [Clostridia bacterium]|nr:stage III sporulation AC/AD family protein [Clostridia bacterium]MBQ5597533.1 stage III sporulation AC/AD family protein [Clostridia bacterium]